MAHDIFLSYAREDLERVRPIVRVLKRQGWTVWWDQKLLAGKRFTDAIQSELLRTRAVIVVWSENSVGSPWVQSEAEEGMQRDILVPVRIADVSPPYPFGRLQGVDHFLHGEPTGAALVLLVKSLEHLIGKPPARPAPARPAPSPAAITPEPTPPALAPERVPERVELPPPSRPEAPSDATGTEKPTAPPRPRRSQAKAPPARPNRPWNQVALVAGGFALLLSFGWVLKTTWAREDRPNKETQPITEDRPNSDNRSNYDLRVVKPGVFDVATDPASGSRLPKGWEVVDGTLGVDGWATQVREPTSGIVLQLIPPGEFLMGSPESEPDRGTDETQHPVQLTRPFYLGVTEVTEAQVLRQGGKSGGSDLPVAIASWASAREFCRKISCDLPTEAQWEYAARAGTTTCWWWGDSPDGGRLKANVFDGTAARELNLKAEFPFSDGFTGAAPVGTFEPNPFGLHDMIGNVWEWCLDDYVEDYGPGEAIDPRIEVTGLEHVVRGGSFTSRLHRTRTASRLFSNGSVIHQEGPDGSRQTGFRVALNPP